MTYKTIQLADIKKAIAKKLKPFSLSQQAQDDLIEGLTRPSLRGVDTHGVSLLSCYLHELHGGRANANPSFKYTGKFPMAQTLDADGASGIVAGMEAIRKAVSLAKCYGVSVVCVKNSNHFGAASVYSLYAAEQDCIGVVMSNADALIAPFNGIQPMLGTNPISVAAAGNGDDIFCLDMATSQVAYTKLKELVRLGQTIPENSMHPAKEVGQVGALKPLGGYKGMNLAFVVQLLSNALTLATPDHQLTHLYSEPFDTPRQVSHFMLCVSIEAFSEPTEFKSYLSRLMQDIRQSAPESPERLIILAGDKELECQKLRLVEGIPLSEHEFKTIFT